MDNENIALLCMQNYLLEVLVQISRQKVKPKISDKWVPKYLNVDQKHARIEASRSVYAQFEKDTNFLSRMVTMNKTWSYFYDSETKQKSRHCGSPRPNKFLVHKSAGKVHTSVSWDCHE